MGCTNLNIEVGLKLQTGCGGGRQSFAIRMEEMYLKTVDRSTEIVLDMKHNVHLSSPQSEGFLTGAPRGASAGALPPEYWQSGAPWAHRVHEPTGTGRRRNTRAGHSSMVLLSHLRLALRSVRLRALSWQWLPIRNPHFLTR